MSQYRRGLVPGGTYFFTVCLQDPAADLLIREIDLLRHATRICLKRMPFTIDAAVILPHLLHMIWTLPPGDVAYAARWRLIKSTFSRHLPSPDHITAGHIRRGKKGIWQRRFWEYQIRDADDFQKHMHLMAAAPVRAGLVTRTGDWTYASWHARGAGRHSLSLRTTDRVPSFPDPAFAERAS